jgi:hypothetical protein
MYRPEFAAAMCAVLLSGIRCIQRQCREAIRGIGAGFMCLVSLCSMNLHRRQRSLMRAPGALPSCAMLSQQRLSRFALRTSVSRLAEMRRGVHLRQRNERKAIMSKQYDRGPGDEENGDESDEEKTPTQDEPAEPAVLSDPRALVS